MAKAKAKASKKKTVVRTPTKKKAVASKRPVAKKKPVAKASATKTAAKTKRAPVKKPIAKAKAAPPKTAKPKVAKKPLVTKAVTKPTKKVVKKKTGATPQPVNKKPAPQPPAPQPKVKTKPEPTSKAEPAMAATRHASPPPAPVPVKAAPAPVRKVINLEEIKLPPNYRPSPNEEYMGPMHLAYFKRKLEDWRQELILESQETLEHLRTETRDVGDEAERASRESDNILELRTRDRYRKLLHKIQEALKRIEDGSYGYCEETGEEIGIGRLEARPIATLTVDAQERREMFQKQFRDDH